MLKKKSKINLFVSVQLLMVFITGLNVRLLTPFGSWLGSIITCQFGIFSQDLFNFSWTRFFFLLLSNGKQFEESVLNSQICLTKGLNFYKK